ncbi:MAG: fimbrillin family protein [Bacteroidales bacterium]|nr:fimbrillin family protein [Bacteroidales bacterium]
MLISCLKDEPVTVLVDDGTVIFVGEDYQPATKTTLNGLQTEWVANTDKVGIFCQQASKTAGGATGVVNEPLTALSSGARSQFSGSVFWNTGDHTFYSYYPYTAGTPPHTAVPVSLPADQTQSAGNNMNHLSSLDFLVAKPYTAKYPGTSGAAATVSLRYNHLFSIIEFQIKRTSSTWSIKKIRIKGTVPLAFGSGTINLSQSAPGTGAPYVINGMTNTSNSVTLTLTSTFNTTTSYTNTAKAYMVVLPGVHSGGVKVGFEVGGMFYEISRTSITFERGKKYVVQVDADSAQIPVIKGSDLDPVTIDGVTWAPVNLGYSSDMPHGLVYQWHRITGFGMNAPAKLLNTNLLDLDIETSITTHKDIFISTSSSSTDWSPVAQFDWNRSEKYNPCPTGWRIPTKAEYQALFAYGNTMISNSSGGVDGLIGRWIGPNHNNEDLRTKTALFFCYPGYFENSPVQGDARRNINNISNYWVNSASSYNGEVLTIRTNEGYNPSMSVAGKAFANPIRCVKNNGYTTPVLYTIKPYQINYDGAKVGGFIEHQGDLPIVERGVFYGLSVNPTSLNVSASTVGVGGFSVTLSRLEPNKVYFVRAYAKNSAGTTYYGDQYKFTTLASQAADYGGQEVTINGLTWAPWNAGYVEGLYPYGLLYQWHRKYGQTYDELPATLKVTTLQTLVNASSYANRNNFYSPSASPYDCTTQPQSSWSMTEAYNPCPVGWHVPTKDEFQSLIDSGNSWGTGPGGTVGRWFGPNHGGSKVGCVFLPASGVRNSDFTLIGRTGTIETFYWTNESISSSSYGLYFKQSVSPTFYGWARATGMSIRCVKD